MIKNGLQNIQQCTWLPGVCEKKSLICRFHSLQGTAIIPLAPNMTPPPPVYPIMNCFLCSHPILFLWTLQRDTQEGQRTIVRVPKKSTFTDENTEHMMGTISMKKWEEGTMVSSVWVKGKKGSMTEQLLPCTQISSSLCTSGWQKWKKKTKKKPKTKNKCNINLRKKRTHNITNW